MTKDEMMQQKKITTAGNPAKPTGEAGEKMLTRMNESHAELTAWDSPSSTGRATKMSSTSAAAAGPTCTA